MIRRRKLVFPLRLLPIAALAGALAGVYAGCTQGPTRHTRQDRIDGPMSHDVRRADVLGLAPAAVLSTAPLNIGDLAKALGEPDDGLHPAAEEAASADGDHQWLARVLERYHGEISDAWDESDHARTQFEPLADPRLRLIFVDEPVKFYNEQGRKFGEGINFFASDKAALRLSNHFLLTLEPELSFGENTDPDGNGNQTILRFQELTFSMRLGPIEATIGRTPLWWGPGRHGALLLSNNALPLDLIKLSTAGPVLLPGFLGYLGLIRGEAFISRLDSSAVVPDVYFGGARVSTRLLPWLELGASRTAQFGGKGRSVTGTTIYHVIKADTENDEDDPGNQLASIDARLIVPWKLQPFEIYGEFGGEDEAGGFFSKNAYIAGLYLPRIGPSHAFELTLEAATTAVYGSERIWYTNRNFPDGYTLHGDILGHHAGTDAIDLFAEVRVHPVDDLSVFLSYDYEEHFILDPVEERLHQFRLGAESRVWKGLWASAFFEYDIWNNFGLNRGSDESGSAAGVGARWEF